MSALPERSDAVVGLTLREQVALERALRRVLVERCRSVERCAARDADGVVQVGERRHVAALRAHLDDVLLLQLERHLAGD